jgi:hypothetical protein
MSEDAIFCNALEKSPEQRAEYLDEACGDNLQLRRRVEALLRSHEECGDFLRPHEFQRILRPDEGNIDPCAVTPANPPLAKGNLAERVGTEDTIASGKRIGSYKILQ